MIPRQLDGKQFLGYPPEARQIAIKNIALLQQLPLAFLPLLLREVIAYDWKFPAERDEIDRQLRYLGGLSPDQLSRVMASFANLKMSSELEAMDWAGAPGAFSERLSAYLWSTHQIDKFSSAAEAYIKTFSTASPEADPPTTRFGIAVIGHEISQTDYPLFRKLRPHGVYFTRIDPKSSYKILLDAVAERSREYPSPFAHWCIDGAGQTTSQRNGITNLAYDSLAPLRGALIRKMQKLSESQAGPEALRTHLVETLPSEVGLNGRGDDPVLSRFAISVLADGAGTQIYSTTFVQLAAKEVLRRARPVTLLTRFASRQTEESADEELSGAQKSPVLDAKGSLVDADMGAYYTWLNLQRLSEANQSAFLAWFEGQREAVAIAPSLVPGSECHDALDLEALLARIRGAQTKE
jgi:hypothetical protein